jgi:hypothetical protein
MIRLFVLFSFALWALTAPAPVRAAGPALFYCPAALGGEISLKLTSAVPTGGTTNFPNLSAALRLDVADTSAQPFCSYRIQVLGGVLGLNMAVRFQVPQNLVGKCTQNKDSQGGITITCGT